MENPLRARFKPLKDQKAKSRRKPPTYKQPELERLWKHCDACEKTIFATLFLTGLREQELYLLDWPDVDLKNDTLRVTAKPAEGFSPKDYEERVIPIPPDLLDLLKNAPRLSLTQN
jgi:integrase/recombinase XerD